MVLPSFSGRGAVAAQVGVVVSGCVAVALAPPAEGVMLLLPLGGQRSAEAVNLAVAAGATVQGEGPVAGSLVLKGRRDRLRHAMRGRAYLLLAASSQLCRG